MMSETGISPVGLATLMIIWSGTTFLFEVPSGVLGDVLPRKYLLILAGFVQAAGFATWWLWPSFTGFAIGFTLWSLGSSFYSGTSEAYLYEMLGDDKSDFPKVYGRSEAASGTGDVLAFAAGGAAASLNYDLPLLMSIAAPSIACILILFLPSADRPQKRATFKDAWEVFRSGAQTVRSNQAVRLIVLSLATLAALPGVFDEYVGVLFDEQGLSLTLIGFVYASVGIARTAGNLLAHRLPGTGMTSPLVMYSACSALLLALAPFGTSLLITGLVIYYLMDGAFEVAMNARLQERVEDHHRATVTSVMSMALETTALILFLTLGIVADVSSWTSALYATAVLSVFLSLIWLARIKWTNRLETT